MANTQALHKLIPASQNKFLFGLQEFFLFAKDPNRLEAVFEINRQLVSPEWRESIAKKIRGSSPTAEQAFHGYRRLSRIDLESFKSYAPGTLGFEYSRFMTKNNLSPESIPSVETQSDGDYIAAHLYETHDIWHVVTGFETNVADELGLQAFYAAQFPFGLPEMLLIAGFFNTLFFAPHELFSRLRKIRQGWNAGRTARRLFGVDWDQYWQTPVQQIRRELRLSSCF